MCSKLTLRPPVSVLVLWTVDAAIFSKSKNDVCLRGDCSVPLPPPCHPENDVPLAGDVNWRAPFSQRYCRMLRITLHVGVARLQVLLIDDLDVGHFFEGIHQGSCQVSVNVLPLTTIRVDCHVCDGSRQ